ncbi:anthranilate synthase component I [Bacillus daqingensis]|uniref:Anthranilate synthase component 1 n=1 Tax=Bacillus daqingensis TaxID=872396 RepID=A0ABV9NSL4_9BACI
MFNFNRESFLDKASRNRTIPLTATITADTKTPVQLFHQFNDSAAFLLESRDPLSPWSSYSFIGLDPFCYLEDEGEVFVRLDRNRRKIWKEETLHNAWERVFSELDPSPDLPDLPFPGGAVGYLSFEGFRNYEPGINKMDAEGHDVQFMFCETILAYHHKEETLTVIHFTDVSDSSGAAYEEAVQRMKQVISNVGSSSAELPLLPVEEEVTGDLFDGVASNYTKQEYKADVNRIKDYIAAGDVFQTVLSQRFEMPVQSDGLSLYRVLRKVNPSPYLYYIRFHDQEVIGSSPERLVKADRNRELEIHPIAGTRKRGKNAVEDRELEADLLADEKERAEHLMLVDLARNDIGRVSDYGSVKVHDMMNISYFSHVMHMTTRVTGTRKDTVHPFEALLATHPAGTVSGAPKVRAVEIIQELEKQRRGVYAGAVAYYGFNKAIDSCIAIRTMILKKGTVYVQAGAGIVQDSVPESEWEETRSKASALLYAVKLAEQRKQKEEVMNHDVQQSH